MKQLSARDVHSVLCRIPADVVAQMRRDPRVFIAGGIIRALIGGEEPADIDMWGPNKDVLELAATHLEKGRLERKENVRTHRTANAITLLTQGRLPVQFVFRWEFDSPVDCAESFDFSICSVAIWYSAEDKKFHSTCHDSFYEDLAAKRLVYLAPKRDEDAGGSMLRVLKYLRRGYNIQVDSLGAVCSRLFKGLWLADDNYKDEAQRTIMLTQLLRAVDPLLMIDGIEMGPEDEHANPERVA